MKVPKPLRKHYRLVLFMIAVLLVATSYHFSNEYVQKKEWQNLILDDLIAMSKSRLKQTSDHCKSIEALSDLVETRLAERRKTLESLATDVDHSQKRESVSRRSQLQVECQELESQLSDLKRASKSALEIFEQIKKQYYDMVREMESIKWSIQAARFVPFGIGITLLLLYSVIRKRLERFVEGLAPKGACKLCEYDLTGNQSGVCPECGTAVPIQTATTS